MIKAEIVNTLLGRARGFMFSKSKRPKLFVFPREGRYGIHMFFVFQNLRVDWLDKNKKLVYSAVAKPFRVYNCKSRKIKYILEVPLD